MYATRRCTHGVPTVYPYPVYPWLTEPEGRQVRVLTGTGTGQPGITRRLPVLIPKEEGRRVSRWILAELCMLIGPEPRAASVVIYSTLLLNSFNNVFNYFRQRETRNAQGRHSCLTVLQPFFAKYSPDI